MLMMVIYIYIYTAPPPTAPDNSLDIFDVDMVKQVSDLNGFVKREQQALTSITEKISTYENMFEQLKKMTGAERLEELVSTYVAHEEEMFRLYNFIQTINAEIDTAVEAYNLLEDEKKVSQEKKNELDNQRESALTDMYERLQSRYIYIYMYTYIHIYMYL
jgi:chromosome segregation ATPase